MDEREPNQDAGVPLCPEERFWRENVEWVEMGRASDCPKSPKIVTNVC